MTASSAMKIAALLFSYRSWTLSTSPHHEPGEGVATSTSTSKSTACQLAFEAAREGLDGLSALNHNSSITARHLKAGFALHYGEVSHGNIGAGDRLDFTVIGPDVNLTSRIERLCRELDPAGKDRLRRRRLRPPDPEALERMPYPRLLLSPTFIGCCLACFGASWAVALGLTWFTPFIITGLGYSQQQAGWISALPWLMGAAAVLTTGFLSQALTARGASPRWARGVVGSTPLVVGGLILLIVPHLADSAWQIVLVVVGGGLCGSIFVVCPPIISSFTPVTQRAAVIAIFVAIYTSAGIFAPVVTGSVIELAATVLQGYYTGYTITGFVQLLGGLAGLLLVWPTTQDTKEAIDLVDARKATR